MSQEPGSRGGERVSPHVLQRVERATSPGTVKLSPGRRVMSAVGKGTERFPEALDDTDVDILKTAQNYRALGKTSQGTEKSMCSKREMFVNSINEKFVRDEKVVIPSLHPLAFIHKKENFGFVFSKKCSYRFGEVGHTSEDSYALIYHVRKSIIR